MRIAREVGSKGVTFMVEERGWLKGGYFYGRGWLEGGYFYGQ